MRLDIATRDFSRGGNERTSWPRLALRGKMFNVGLSERASGWDTVMYSAITFDSRRRVD